FTGDQLGQEVGLQGLVAEFGDLADGSEVGGLQYVSAVRADTAHRIHHHDGVEEAPALSAVSLRNGDAGHTLLGGNPSRVPRVAVSLESSLGERTLSEVQSPIEEVLMLLRHSKVHKCS